MTIIEAVKSGRPFRRKFWLTSLADRSMAFRADEWAMYYEGMIGKNLRTADLLADDWEIDNDDCPGMLILHDHQMRCSKPKHHLGEHFYPISYVDGAFVMWPNHA